MNKAPAIGGYELGQQINVSRLSEVSASEYSKLGRTFEEERIYRGSRVSFVDHHWDLLVGTLGNEICKLAIVIGPTTAVVARPAAEAALRFLTSRLGDPTRSPRPGVLGYAWEAADGNVVFEVVKAGDLHQVNLVETSGTARERFESPPAAERAATLNAIQQHYDDSLGARDAFVALERQHAQAISAGRLTELVLGAGSFYVAFGTSAWTWVRILAGIFGAMWVLAVLSRWTSRVSP